MALSLKTSGVATQIALLICVDDDNVTIKDFGPSAVSVTNTGVTVNTGKTWKGSSVPMMTFADATDKLVLGATTPHIVSPACIFWVCKDSSASDSEVLGYGSATAGGSASISDDPYMAMGSNPSPVLRDGLSNIIALPTITLSPGDDWSLFFNSNAAYPNVSYMALEANALSGSAPSFSWDPGGTVFSVDGFLKQIGTNGAPTWTADLVMMGILVGAISQADAALIHADPRGTLLTAAAGGAFGRPYYNRLLGGSLNV